MTTILMRSRRPRTSSELCSWAQPSRVLNLACVLVFVPQDPSEK